MGLLDYRALREWTALMGRMESQAYGVNLALLDLRGPGVHTDLKENMDSQGNPDREVSQEQQDHLEIQAVRVLRVNPAHWGPWDLRDFQGTLAQLGFREIQAQQDLQEWEQRAIEERWENEACLDCWAHLAPLEPMG